MVLKSNWASGEVLTATDFNTVANDVNAATANVATVSTTVATKADSSTVSALTLTVATKEPTITAGTATQYYRGDKTFQTLNADAVPDGTTNKAFLATERTKLAGIATAATANSADATLLARANHTGTQLASTISDFSTAADARVAAGITGKENTSNKGIANGYASLDSGGKVPVTQLPSSIMEYQGVWNASTNTPTLANGTGSTGDVYRVSVAGTALTIAFEVGDYAIYNGTTWEKSDTTDAVASVAGKTGIVTLTSSDVGLGNVSNVAAATAATASSIAQRDASGNLTADNFHVGFTTTATSAGTTTLTIDSFGIQEFTGTQTHTVVLPTTSSVPAGAQYRILNNSTGAVAVQSSTLAAIHTMAPGVEAVFTALITNPTLPAHWEDSFYGTSYAAGKSLTVNKTLTLDGTDGTTVTFPTTNATIARTDAAQTFTGVQTMTSPALTTPAITGAITGTYSFGGTPTWPTFNQNTTGSAATLTTSRTFQTDLASTTAAGFTGAANNIHGVTGILPIANGGTGTTTGSGNVRVGTIASTATPSIDCGLYDQYNITAQTVTITGFTITGTPFDGQKLTIRIKSDTSNHAITGWGTSIISSGVAYLPSIIYASKTHLVGLLYDSIATKWVCVASDEIGY
jgi:hypothetical protein